MDDLIDEHGVDGGIDEAAVDPECISWMRQRVTLTGYVDTSTSLITPFVTFYGPPVAIVSSCVITSVLATHPPAFIPCLSLPQFQSRERLERGKHGCYLRVPYH
eukprot:TRINITY_DN1232_c0_g1_i2.p1 TRINITY_DN1232_c0_g1~~TRINITY_DN1232_c0_g1_i2.p1  ORF type:complete len:104 (+),score=3.65 TRINITY_DN1232_c0_g1_i2:127-438(+)